MFLMKSSGGRERKISNVEQGITNIEGQRPPLLHFIIRHSLFDIRNSFFFRILGVWRMAHDPAKVEGQVRLLTRIFPGRRSSTGGAALSYGDGCGFDSHGRH